MTWETFLGAINTSQETVAEHLAISDNGNLRRGKTLFGLQQTDQGRRKLLFFINNLNNKGTMRNCEFSGEGGFNPGNTHVHRILLCLNAL